MVIQKLVIKNKEAALKTASLFYDNHI